jgi:hypothetical protein
MSRLTREHRAHLRAVIFVEPPAVAVLQLVVFEEADARLREQRAQFATPEAVLILDHAAHALRHERENLGGGASVHAALRHVAFHLLLEAGDANLEEFVEVRADDAEKLHALEQRVRGIAGFGEHALVEFEPAQLAVQEYVGWKFSHVSCSAPPCFSSLPARPDAVKPGDVTSFSMKRAHCLQRGMPPW